MKFSATVGHYLFYVLYVLVLSPLQRTVLVLVIDLESTGTPGARLRLRLRLRARARARARVGYHV